MSRRRFVLLNNSVKLAEVYLYLPITGGLYNRTISNCYIKFRGDTGSEHTINPGYFPFPEIMSFQMINQNTVYCYLLEFVQYSSYNNISVIWLADSNGSLKGIPYWFYSDDYPEFNQTVSMQFGQPIFVIPDTRISYNYNTLQLSKVDPCYIMMDINTYKYS